MDMDRFFAIVIPLLLVFLADRILRTLFIKWYLRFGVPVFSVGRDLPGAPSEWPSPKSLESHLRHVIFGHTVFRDFGDGLYGFHFGSHSLLHGLLEFRATPPHVRATAKASIGTCLFVLFWFGWTLITGAPGLTLGGAAVLAALVVVEYGRLLRLIEEARRQCTLKIGGAIIKRNHNNA